MTSRPIAVLFSFPAPRPTSNPYVAQLVACMPGDIEVLTFSWRAALLGRWDVFHVHWPEILLRGNSWLSSIAKQLLTVALLLRVRITRRAVVRTLHNQGPHERPSRLEAVILGLFDRWTTETISLNKSVKSHLHKPDSVILHGDYSSWFDQYPHPETERGRLLFFGQIRPYKQVEALATAFRQTDDEALSLHVVGLPKSADLAVSIQRAAEGDKRISLNLSHADDRELSHQIGKAELVVLAYREMTNSGAALLALSLGRPILVPASEATRELSTEVGPRWVLLFEGSLSSEVLVSALATLRDGSARTNRLPDLSQRGWPGIGRRHEAVYRSAIQRASPS